MKALTSPSLAKEYVKELWARSGHVDATPTFVRFDPGAADSGSSH